MNIFIHTGSNGCTDNTYEFAEKLLLFHNLNLESNVYVTETNPFFSGVENDKAFDMFSKYQQNKRKILFDLKCNKLKNYGCCEFIVKEICNRLSEKNFIFTSYNHELIKY